MEISHEIIRALGMTLMHSLWQGTIIGMTVLFILALTRKSDARFRYIVLFSGLTAILVGFIVTFSLLFRHQYLAFAGQKALLLSRFTAEYSINSSLLPTQAQFTQWISTLLEPAYPMLAMGWLAGFLFIGIRMTLGLMVTRFNLRKLEYPDPTLQRIFERSYNRLGLSFSVSLRITSRMISPMVTGILKPAVIIPVAAISGLSPEQIETVIVHELAHIKRFDHILVILQAIAAQVLFFHPVVWFLNREIDRERENCCDDLVIKMNNNPIIYIKALTMIQEMNIQGAVPANALTGKSNQLLNRVKRLVKPEHKHTTAFRMAVVLLFLATVGLSAMTILLTGNQIKIDKGNDDRNELALLKDHQPDSVVRSLNNQNGNKKKMKVIFMNDTIKEMTVNGKPVGKEEMKEYTDEIRKMQEELASSQNELEKANERLKEAQEELEAARKEMEIGDEYLYRPELRDLNRQIQDVFSESHLSPDEFKHQWQTEKFREEMKKAQEEATKAFEEINKKRQEYWSQHEGEWKEEMKKAQEEARKAFEEMRRNKEFYFNQNGILIEPELGLPAVPAIPCPAVPHLDDLNPLIPGIPSERLPEESDQGDQSGKEPLDSQLRQLESE